MSAEQQSPISIDKDKQDNIDYLFDNNPLPIHINDHQQQSDHDEIDIDIDLKQHSNEIEQNKVNDMNPEQVLHNKVTEHNRPNYTDVQKSKHQTDEALRVQSRSFFFVLMTVVMCQIIIWFWRKKHPRSFFIATLFGLWIFPVILSAQMHYWRMIFVWSIFSVIFGILLHMSRQRPMNRKTPRYLYSWFYLLYKLTSYLSIIGYILFLADFFGLGILFFGPHPTEEREYRNKLVHHQHEAHVHALEGDSDVDSVKQELLHEQEELNELSHGYSHIHFSDMGIYLLFYGLYYGVLARDTAQLCADWISAALGFFNPSGFPRRRVPANICAVCNNPLMDHNIGLFDHNEEDLTPTDADSTTDRRMKLMQQRRRMDEKTAAGQNATKYGFPFNLCSFSNTKQDEEVQINCKHRFHGFCIRGWIMIGKRDVCPVCKEKVNLKGIFANPWHKQDRMWSQLLDGVRYLLVWNPIIVLAANLVFSVSGISFLRNKKPNLADH